MARLLLLGPERQCAAGLRTMLVRDGHQVTWLRSLENWASHEREFLPDLVVAAVSQTDPVLAAAVERPLGFPPPILFVQHEADFLREPRDERRLVDCLASPFMCDELLARVEALVTVRQVVERNAYDDAVPQRRGWTKLRRNLSSWLRSRLPEQERPSAPYLEVAARVAEWADRRDAFEPGHAARVTSLCGMIACGLGMDEQETTQLLRAAMLHDIGKVALPVEVLHQRRPLEEEQRRLIRTHPARGAALLRALDPDESVARVVLCHHERPDGSGYYGKSGNRVPRAAYALAVAESYDAMTSSLLGRTLDSGPALDRLESRKGASYDADCVDALVDALKPRIGSISLSRV
jgi:HD-GYP domain-containing protein (c-di-GMP phosphodiesterase class II)